MTSFYLHFALLADLLLREQHVEEALWASDNKLQRQIWHRPELCVF